MVSSSVSALHCTFSPALLHYGVAFVLFWAGGWEMAKERQGALLASSQVSSRKHPTIAFLVFANSLLHLAFASQDMPPGTWC